MKIIYSIILFILFLGTTSLFAQDKTVWNLPKEKKEIETEIIKLQSQRTTAESKGDEKLSKELYLMIFRKRLQLVEPRTDTYQKQLKKLRELQSDSKGEDNKDND
jgi:hypothetical protein